MDPREIEAAGGRQKFYEQLIKRYGHPCGEDCPCGNYDGEYKSALQDPGGSPYSGGGIFLVLALLVILALLVAELGQKFGLWVV